MENREAIISAERGVRNAEQTASHSAFRIPHSALASLPLRLLLRRQQPLGVCLLLRPRRLRLGLRSRTWCGGPCAAAAGVGNHLFIIAWLAGSVVNNRFEPGGGPPLVDLARNGRFAIAE